jgi:hypothetical protein
MRVSPRPNGKYITPRLAEAEYGIPYGRIYLWIQRGLIPRIDQDVTGRAILFKREDFEKFLEENTTTRATR